MEERGVIDIERDFAHDREGAFAFFVIVNAHVARDQAAKRIESEAADGSFHAALVQLFDHFVAPAAAETFLGQIPAAEGEPGDEKDDR